MLFLLNDVVLRLDPRVLHAGLPPSVVDNLSLDWVLRRGAKLFAAAPDLLETAPRTAERLALLIAAKAEGVNAAWFVAPRPGCDWRDVSVELAGFDADGLAALAAGFDGGEQQAA
jgi:hypothetical protein